MVRVLPCQTWGWYYAVEDEVGEGDGVDEVLLLTRVEGPAQPFQFVGGRLVAELLFHVFVGLDEEASGAARGGRPSPTVRTTARIDLAGREELSAVVVLLAHLQEQPLVCLGEEAMCCGSAPSNRISWILSIT